jgi:flavin-dependent dehydrogenase
MGKKIVIIGAGTAGCLTAAVMISLKEKYEIELIYDPSKPAASVGEASNFLLSNFLGVHFDFLNTDLKEIKGTIKRGIQKNNWGEKNYFHSFLFGNYAIHMDSKEFQKWFLNKLSKNITVTERNIENTNDISADYIIDCTGKYKKEEVNNIESIAVNASYVTQCYWEKPEFDYTLTIARPYGWVFGVPLKDRCSIGYLFNSDINNVDEIKEDVKEIFKEFNLNPSKKTNLINFKSYYKKNNFNGNIFYNGNSSFFTEPLEATTLHMQIFTATLIKDSIEQGSSVNKQLQEIYEGKIKEQCVMIALHYIKNKNFETKFWKNAELVSNKIVKNACYDENFRSILNEAFQLENTNYSKGGYTPTYGTWPPFSFYWNIKHLGIKDILKKYLKLW